MDIIEAIILGAVQGITEFLPISSTAHLILVPWFMGWSDRGLAFDVALHLGTLCALLIYFRKEWIQLTLAGVKLLRGQTTDPNSRMVVYIVLGTIPGAVCGVVFKDFVESTLRTPLVISVTLIVLALVLIVAEKAGRRNKDLQTMSFADAMVVGVAQAIALIPGVSRSGITITAGLFRGLTRETAARFSFFLSTPIIAGAVASELLEIAKGGLTGGQLLTLIAGIVSAAVVGYASIAFLLRYLSTHNTFVFIYYRIALGIVVYLVFWSGFR